MAKAKAKAKAKANVNPNVKAVMLDAALTASKDELLAMTHEELLEFTTKLLEEKVKANKRLTELSANLDDLEAHMHAFGEIIEMKDQQISTLLRVLKKCFDVKDLLDDLEDTAEELNDAAKMLGINEDD